MSFTLPHPTLTNPPVKEEIEDNFAAIVQKFGAFDTSDLSADADIANSQLAQPYQDALFTLRVRAESFGSPSTGWPGANTVVDSVIVPGLNNGPVTDPAWKVVQVSWACNDTGAGTGVFSLRWGHFDTGAFTSVLTITGGGAIVNTGGADASWGAATRSVDFDSGETLAFSTTPRCLTLVGTTADATCVSAAGSWFTCSVVLRRALRGD